MLTKLQKMKLKMALNILYTYTTPEDPKSLTKTYMYYAEKDFEKVMNKIYEVNQSYMTTYSSTEV